MYVLSCGHNIVVLTFKKCKNNLILTLSDVIAQTSSLRQLRFSRSRRVFPEENIIEGTTKQNKHRRHSKQTNKRARVALDPASILQNLLSHKWGLLLHCFLPSVCKKETVLHDHVLM